MKRLLCILLALAGSLSVARALNLAPHEIVVERDGPPVRRYFFDDEGKRMIFRIDGAMSVSGSSTQAIFQFSDIRNATMRLAKSSMTTEVPFEGKNIELYRAAARGYVSAEATAVQVLEEKADALPINGWVSYQFVLAYKLFGVPYRQSITFFNYGPTQQLVFDVASPEAEYEKTYHRGYSVINSLGDEIPSQTAGPT